ncbi:DMP19 family protein [Chryseobacterium oranimense]|uniref:DMP19 family protein n=1 Tax=Chryseobacterium oranimense TaxID=421058 RepID=UPI0021AE502E|nr:DMP19 family protein [Chryseobacterium oranimense]UWX60373.1 DMP19 family protein [Chryseobacterium oranimense]
MNNQELIEKTYLESTKGIREDWFISEIPHWYSYVINLPKHLQVTYLTVVLENQVLNGGFHQYFVNSYGQFAKETIDALIEIGAFKKSNLLDKALNIVKDKSISDENFRKELVNKTLKKLFIDDDLFDPLEELDDLYYETEDEDINILLGDYLSKQSKN